MEENVAYNDVFDVPRPPALPPQNVQRPPEPLSFGRSPLHFPREAAISQDNNRCCRSAFSKMNVALMFAVAFFAILSTVFAVMYFTIDKKDKTCSGSWKYLGYGCVGAKDNQYLELPYPGPSVFIGAVKLVHTNGTVGNIPSYNSYWGAKTAQGIRLGMVVTDLKNRVIYPSVRRVSVSRYGWYRLPGYSSTSPELVLSDFQNPKYLRNGEKMRIWYGEDLRDHSESDNHGKTCMCVYVYSI